MTRERRREFLSSDQSGRTVARRARNPAAALMRAFLPAPRRRATKSVRRAVNRAAAAAGKKAPARKKAPVRKSAGAVGGAGAAGTAMPGGTGSWRRFRYVGPAGTRSYFVYVPRGLRKTSPAPLLLALHGCAQNATEFAAATRFNQLADTHSFIVVYPEQVSSANSQRCWNWFRTSHQHRDAGEPAILAGIVAEVLARSAMGRIDPHRIYLTGLSAGGAMAVVLAAEYPELFAAVGVHSAPPYRSATRAFDAPAAMAARTHAPPGPAGPGVGPMPPMIVFQGSRDHVVSPVNAQRLADQWLAYNEVHADRRRSEQIARSRSTSTAAGSPVSARSRRGHRVSRWYSNEGQKSLEVWVVDGLAHAWSGGATPGSYTDPHGPRASTEMWRFFAAHPHRRASAG